MLILLALLLSAGFIALCHKSIKANSALFYIIAAAFTLLIGFFDFSFLPVPIQNTLIGLFSRGAFATALWIVVMWTGALKNGSKLMKKLMPIRGELSIFAAILTLGHNIFYGKTYFVRLFTNAASLPWTQLAAAIMSVVMLLLLLPLTITSFPAVRKKMQVKKWKKLQRWAYLYYALLYVHIMLVTMPGALTGELAYVVSVIVYNAAFLSYLCWRVRKYLVLKKKVDPKKTLAAAAAIIILGMTVLVGALYAGSRPVQGSQYEAAGQLQGDAEIRSTVSEQGNESITVSGHAYGYDGEVYVTVTLENGVITEITGYAEESDDFYFNRCYEKVTTAIIETQSCDVDAVSEATYSSHAIMDAVEAALKQVK